MISRQLELQSLRYAAMVLTLTLKRAIEIHQQYLDKRGIEKDAKEEILGFLGGSDPQEEQFPRTFGVVAPLAKVWEKGQKRYFLGENQVLQTGDGQTVAVCNQWGIGNIGPFFDIAKQLGYEVTAQ